MALQDLLGQVINSITHHSDQQQHTGFDPSNLLGDIQGLFSQHAENTGQVLPASQDPYGDPADQGGLGGNIRPASEDPRGDPADQGGLGGNIRPASEDPRGDPADQSNSFGSRPSYANDRARGIRPASEDPLGDPAERAA